MTDGSRQGWITGVGIVSCLGEGLDAHWEALTHGQPSANTTMFPPYLVHPLVPIELGKQIPRKSDQRQMNTWQKIGTYAAGLALDSAGVKGDAEILTRMDMIVGTGGGERDIAVDSAILSGITKADNPAAFLNERMMNDLRPSLFLTQLPNLLAGNISIVHGVTGSSRTFMGEESAGINAVQVGLARIASGQSDIVLVGGSHNCEREDTLLLHEFGSFNLKRRWVPVWHRQSVGGGFALGSLGAFLVIEARSHAEARGTIPLATLSIVKADRSDGKAGAVTSSLRRMWKEIEPLLKPGRFAVISGASGAEPSTTEERKFLSELCGIPVRATGTHLGHGMEPQFPMNVALAALAVGRGQLFPATDSSGVEQPMNGVLSQVVVTGVGHWRGEGMALVQAATSSETFEKSAA
jgi:3-oxoacyl-[acyl-carrier-protein] synthase II